MLRTDHTAMNDDGLNAYLFGLVFDCPESCDEACPVHGLPTESLTETFDAIHNLPRTEKLELIQFPLACPTRRRNTAQALTHERKEGENGTLELPDITHLIPMYLKRY